MLAPGLAFLLLLAYIPMFGSLIAFKEIDYSLGIFGSPWIGFENFRFLFSSPDAYQAISNTLMYNLFFIFTGPVISIALAIGLNELMGRKAKKLYQTLIILPYFFSFVVVSYIVYVLLGSPLGLINKTLESSGIETIPWYQSPEYWPWILFITHGWKAWGFGTIIYLATMTGFDQEIYEAARIDGANRWAQITKITLPLLMPIVSILFILSLGNIFRADFGLFCTVPRGSTTLMPATQVLDTFVYRSLIMTRDIGMSSAAGLLQSIVGFFTILTANLVIRKFAPDRALF